MTTARRTDIDHAGPRTTPDLALGVSGVSVRLGGRQILDHVGFEVAAGEFAGLIGSNGAGKTTLLKVILGLQSPDAGRVEVAGRAPGRRIGGIGYVPQKFLFDPDAPVRARDLVALGIDGQRWGFALPTRARRRRVDELLEAVDGQALADARIGTLSGGEQQRVLIAHALASRPRVLVMDEPLANLDLAGAQEIVGLLARVSTEQRVGVLLSAHEMNQLLPVMDRIVYLAHGRAASGPTREVVTSATLSRLYGYPVEVLDVHGRIIVVAGATGTAPVDSPAEPGAGGGPDGPAGSRTPGPPTSVGPVGAQNSADPGSGGRAEHPVEVLT